MSDIQKLHLDWSAKQSRILTGGGKAKEYYTAERGFPFAESELPHYHLLQGDTDATFQTWRQALFLAAKETQEEEAPATKKAKTEDDNNNAPEEEEEEEEERVKKELLQLTHHQPPKAELLPLVGAWTRLLFFGGWEHSSIKDERTYNLQTNNLFIDLRIPKTRDELFANVAISSLEVLNKEQLKWYARQHVFAGYTQVGQVSTPIHQEDYLCTRHHCIDWNFVGTPRPRPNKWWAELQQPTNDDKDNTATVQTWKEWAFATDNRGQHYYCEQWERLEEGDPKPMLALAKATPKERDGMILIVGDHFNYILARDLSSLADSKQPPPQSSLVSLVDDCLDKDDLVTARAYLSTQGGHGRVSQGFQIDCAIEPWKEGTCLLGQSDELSIVGDQVQECHFLWNGEAWNVFDTTLSTVEEIQSLVFGNLK